MKWIAITAALALYGCGYIQHEQARSALSQQITADGDACRKGDQNACHMYQMEIQRCSILSTDPVCQNL